MKFFLDLQKKQLVKSAASNVALERLVLKRRDSLAVEVVFVQRNAVADMPVGTTTTVALKRTFADSNFLALASGEPPTLDLNTVPLEAIFSDTNPASIPALLEIRWSVPGETTRNATLQVEVQNSVILGTEQTPLALPDGKATEEEATAGEDNTKWMTPLRTRQAINVLAGQVDLILENFDTEKLDSIAEAAESIVTLADEVSANASAISSEAASRAAADAALSQSLADESTARQASDATLQAAVAGRAPLAHTHTASHIADFAEAVVAVSPPVDWSSLTGKPSTFPPSGHTHPTSEIPGLDQNLADLEAADTALSERIDFLAENLDPAAIDSIAEAAASLNTLQAQLDTHTHTSEDITDFAQAVATAAPAPTTPANSGLSVSGTSLATAYNTTIADSVVSVAVGGAPAAPASAWKSKNLVQVLDDILFPTILASISSAKSLTLAVSGSSGTLEIGSSHSRTLTATFGRGTILDGNGSLNANPLVGAATGYTFTGTGISSTSQAGATLSFTAAIVSGSNSWAVTAAHAAGSGQYFDNKGVAGTNLDASRSAATATASSSTPTITGVHPYYYLKRSTPITTADMVAAIQNGTATKVIAASTGTLSIPYAPSAEYLAVAYPSTSTTKTRYFVTALDNGAITVVFAPVSTQTVTTALWSQSYRIHVSTGALTNSNATIELRNT